MYIARQPIFDRNLKVYAYELLYRMDHHSVSYTASSYEQSTATVLGGLFELIQPGTLVIEILENVVMDEKLLLRIADLKGKGYMLALDDFENSIRDYPAAPYADVVKYDIMITPLSSLEDEVKEAKRQKKILLAEKVETIEEYEKAKEMGFQLFQGYFFSKPVIVGGLRSRKSNVSVYQRIIQELREEEPSFQKITEIIETDVNLAYRVMKVMGNKEPSQKTIKSAITKMGLRELERWVNVLMLQDLSKNKPQELVRMSLIRTRFGEQIAQGGKYRGRRHEIALLCLFSVIDAMLDMPMEEALEGIAISQDIREALVDQAGKLSLFLEVVKCYERGDCNRLKEVVEDLGVAPEKMTAWYVESISWADKVMRMM